MYKNMYACQGVQIHELHIAAYAYTIWCLQVILISEQGPLKFHTKIATEKI